MNASIEKTRAASRGFTLIELIAVMVVLAVLAGVAIPKYFDYADRAKTSALQGALGGVRSGIANFHADQAIDGDAQYPTATELEEVGTVMQEELPENPYNNLNNVQEINSPTNAENRVVQNETDYGWNYYVNNAADPPEAIFWANSDDDTTATDEQGDPIPANEL